MADLSMCLDHECPYRKRCHRYTAVTSYHQSYMNWNRNPEDERCKYYWDNRGYRKADEHKDSKHKD